MTLRFYLCTWSWKHNDYRALLLKTERLVVRVCVCKEDQSLVLLTTVSTTTNGNAGKYSDDTGQRVSVCVSLSSYFLSLMCFSLLFPCNILKHSHMRTHTHTHNLRQQGNISFGQNV